MAIVYRFNENQTDRLPELAADLIRRQVTVIAAMSTVAAADSEDGNDDNPYCFRRRRRTRSRLVLSPALPDRAAT